ncbi:MAG: acyl carrier protein [Phycisphaeraceae bacterium]|nr:acyl carrier protein [Phycisphaeraceae bacterium]
MALTHDEVLGKVRSVLVEALGADEDEVTPEATLVGDLGAESIDFLDIVFRLEKAFGIKVEQGELFPEAVFTDPKYVVDEKVTDEGLAELRKRLPHMNLDKFAQSRKVEEFPQMITVEDIVRFVEKKAQ